MFAMARATTEQSPESVPNQSPDHFSSVDIGGSGGRIGRSRHALVEIVCEIGDQTAAELICETGPRKLRKGALNIVFNRNIDCGSGSAVDRKQAVQHIAFGA